MPQARRAPVRRRVAAAAVAVVVAACSTGDGPPQVDVTEAGAGAQVLDPRGRAAAPIDDGGWPQLAATVAANAADGRPTVVNLFASWCLPCAEELPLLLDTARARPDVVFVGVSVQDLPRDRAVEFVVEQGVDWPVVWDRDATVSAALEGRVMPVTAGFDADGRLVRVVQGQVDEASLSDLLDVVGG